MVTEYKPLDSITKPNPNFDADIFSHDDLRENKFSVEIHEWQSDRSVKTEKIATSIVGFVVPELTVPYENYYVGNYDIPIHQNKILYGMGQIYFRNTVDLNFYLYCLHTMQRNADNPIYDGFNDDRTKKIKYKGVDFGENEFFIDLHVLVHNNMNVPIYRIIHHNVNFHKLGSLSFNILKKEPDVMIQQLTFVCERIEFAE